MLWVQGILWPVFLMCGPIHGCHSPSILEDEENTHRVLTHSTPVSCAWDLQTPSAPLPLAHTLKDPACPPAPASSPEDDALSPYIYDAAPVLHSVQDKLILHAPIDTHMDTQS